VREACVREKPMLSLALGLSIMLTFSQGGATPAYKQFGAGARPAGLGGAFTAIADDANSAVWNAANMALASGPELTVTHTKSYLGSSIDCLAGILPFQVFDRFSSVGFYLLRTAVGDIPLAPPLPDTVTEGSPHSFGDFETICVALALGARLSKFFMAGMSGDLVRTRLLSADAVGRAFHISISVDAERSCTLLERTTVSLHMRNLAAALSWSSGHHEPESPYMILGVAHRPMAGDRLIISADLEGTPWESNLLADLRFGLEFLLVNAVPLRFGYDGQSAAVGMGCRGNSIQLDYALSFHEELAESHCVSLTLRI
jgi:hypothetical protein